MTLYYFESDVGAGIRTGASASDVENRLRREVGTRSRIHLVREADADDITWVRGMGGYIPEISAVPAK
jgi:hypothetical protein